MIGNIEKIVGRDEELGRVRAFLDSAAALVLVMEGEPGIGKTTLWSEAAEIARANGARILVSRPTSSEAHLSFAGLGDLLSETLGRLLPVHAGTWLGLRHLWADELDEARPFLEREHDRAVANEDDAQRSGVLLHLVELDWRTGNWKLARERAELGYDLAEQVGDEQGRGALLYARALIDGHLGRVEEARRATAEGLRIAAEVRDRLFPLMHAVAAGALEVSLGNYREALGHLGALAERQWQMGIHEPGIAVYQGDEIEALVEVGALAQAESRIRELERRGEELGRVRALAVSARGGGLVLAARGDLDGALAAFEQAHTLHDRLPVPFERARTLLVHGRTLRRTKRKRAAREVLVEATEIFDELGARLWSERARAEARRIGGRTAASTELTPAAQQVAVQVAAGKSNKEVAAALFVTVHTVERHLSRVYAKLGVRSRTELVARLSKE